SFVLNSIACSGGKPGWRNWWAPTPEQRRQGKLTEWEINMKVVLFCGGQGLRIRDAEDLPKPMVHIGYRPILWHVMKYYAHFGHKDFILCLGHRAGAIKKYFLHYNECASNDFILSVSGQNVELLNRYLHDCRITFADT